MANCPKCSAPDFYVGLLTGGECSSPGCSLHVAKVDKVVVAKQALAGMGLNPEAQRAYFDSFRKKGAPVANVDLSPLIHEKPYILKLIEAWKAGTADYAGSDSAVSRQMHADVMAQVDRANRRMQEQAGLYGVEAKPHDMWKPSDQPDYINNIDLENDLYGALEAYQRLTDDRASQMQYLASYLLQELDDTADVYTYYPSVIAKTQAHCGPGYWVTLQDEPIGEVLTPTLWISKAEAHNVHGLVAFFVVCVLPVARGLVTARRNAGQPSRTANVPPKLLAAAARVAPSLTARQCRNNAGYDISDDSGKVYGRVGYSAVATLDLDGLVRTIKDEIYKNAK